MFSARFKIETDNKSTLKDDRIGFYLKDAYLIVLSVYDRIDAIIGIQPTMAFEVSESIWGNRFVEKTIMGLRGIQSSRDFGVSLKTRIDHAGNYKFCLMYGNNSGLKNEFEMNLLGIKVIRFFFFMSLLKNLSLSLFANYSDAKKIYNSYSGSFVKNNTSTSAFFIGYKERNNYSLGFERFLSLKQNDFRKNGKLQNRFLFGISTFCEYFIFKNLSLFLRADYFDLNINKTSKSDSRYFYVAGCKYIADEKVFFSVNVLAETYEKIQNSRKIDPSITPRFTFFYAF